MTKKDNLPIYPEEIKDIQLRTATIIEKPSMYKVVMMNDDYSPMDFVIFILMRFFLMSHELAKAVMLKVHESGSGLCGIYTYEIAETKAKQVHDFARKYEHPLKCRIERE